MRTWVPDALWMGFDVTLMVSSPPAEAAAFRQSAGRPVRIANTFQWLGRNESRAIERWKVHAFFTEFPTASFDWHVMLDDDTVPNLPSLMQFLCVAAAQYSPPGQPQKAVYMGWTLPSSSNRYTYATGQGFVLSRTAALALQGQMARLARVHIREACHDPLTLAHKPRWWAGCCAVNDGVVTSFDSFVGSCMLLGSNAALTSMGNASGGWWPRLFHHGGRLKNAAALEPHAIAARQQGWQAACGSGGPQDGGDVQGCPHRAAPVGPVRARAGASGAVRLPRKTGNHSK